MSLLAPVVISAPLPAQAQTLQNWYGRAVPTALRPVQPLAVRVLTPNEMGNYLRADGKDDTDAGNDVDVDGTFDTNPDVITVRQEADGQPDRWTFAHELGHAVWAHTLSRADRKQYSSLYDGQKRAHHLVTRYAAQDAEEGFAEAYSFYVCAPPMLAARDMQSFQFFTHFVRRRASARP